MGQMLDECWRVHFGWLVWKCKTKLVFPLGGKFRWFQQQQAGKSEDKVKSVILRQKKICNFYRDGKS